MPAAPGGRGVGRDARPEGGRGSRRRGAQWGFPRTEGTLLPSRTPPPRPPWPPLDSLHLPAPGQPQLPYPEGDALEPFQVFGEPRRSREPLSTAARAAQPAVPGTERTRVAATVLALRSLVRESVRDSVRVSGTSLGPGVLRARFESVCS